MFDKILLACDGSPHALLSAKKKVSEIAKESPDSKVSFVYVVDENTSKSDVLSSGDSLEEKHHQKISFC